MDAAHSLDYSALTATVSRTDLVEHDHAHETARGRSLRHTVVDALVSLLVFALIGATVLFCFWLVSVGGGIGWLVAGAAICAALLTTWLWMTVNALRRPYELAISPARLAKFAADNGLEFFAKVEFRRPVVPPLNATPFEQETNTPGVDPLQWTENTVRWPANDGRELGTHITVRRSQSGYSHEWKSYFSSPSEAPQFTLSAHRPRRVGTVAAARTTTRSAPKQHIDVTDSCDIETSSGARYTLRAYAKHFDQVEKLLDESFLAQLARFPRVSLKIENGRAKLFATPRHWATTDPVMLQWALDTIELFEERTKDSSQ